MSLDPRHQLSRLSVEALDGLVAGEDTVELLSDETLAKFLRNELSPKDREQVAQISLRSVTARKRLVELYREATGIFSSPVEQWTAANQTDFFLEPLRELLRIGDDQAPLEWDLIVESSQRRYSAARAILREIARNVALGLSAPRFAQARSGSPTQPLFFAQITEDGTLVAQIPADRGIGSEGAPVLMLADPLGGSFQVAEGILRDGIWTFHAKSFGTLTGMEPGSLPNSLFQIKTKDRDPGEGGPSYLWAEDEHGEWVVISLERPPRIVAGKLTLVVRLSTAIREALKGKRLVLSLPLGEFQAILGSWSIAEEQEFAVLEANAYDLPEGDLLFGSILRGRIVDDKGE